MEIIKKMINFLQINLAKSPEAHALAEVTIRNSKVDIVLVSEANKRYISENEGWFKDSKSITAIKVFNKSMKVYDWGIGKGFVWIVIDDIQIFSCYVSPNVSLNEFKIFLDGIKTEINSSKYKRFIVGGDLNSKSYLWHSRKEDDRGKELCEWIVEMNLDVMNKGNTPTFVRGKSSSIIDITMCSRNLTRKIENWRVTEDENLSDHQYIFFELIQCDRTTVKETMKDNSWRYNEKRKETFKEELNERLKEISKKGHIGVEECVIVLQEMCQKIFGTREGRDGRPPVYWWNENIAEMRKQCHAGKRKMSRTNKKRTSTDQEKSETRKRYYKLKEVLRQEINISKKKKWEELCADLNKNVWGSAYKIACKKLKLFPSKELKAKDKLEIAKELFPTDEVEGWKRENVDVAEIPRFTMEEVHDSIQKLRSKKAPGPDGLGGEIIKILFDSAPDLCTSLFNDMLVAGEFPKEWKTAKLVLLEKGKKEGSDKMAYRPICLLNVMGKTMEHLVKTRLILEIKEKGDLARNQYGFREGMSTIDAMEEVLKNAQEAKKSKKLCVMVLVDVKNALILSHGKAY